jgi:predicted transcriptional regulator
MPSATTSVRLDKRLVHRLEQAAAKLSRGKNWIVVKALDEYLAKVNREDLVAEARRQSRLCARAERRGKGPGFPEEDIEGWS